MLIPKENEKDLAEIPDNVKRGLTVVAVGSADELLKYALVSPPQPIEWREDGDNTQQPVLAPKSEDDRPGVVTH